jgi:hypothetical protein
LLLSNDATILSDHVGLCVVYRTGLVGGKQVTPKAPGNFAQA